MKKISVAQYDVLHRFFSLHPEEWAEVWELSAADAYAIIHELYDSPLTPEIIQQMNQKLRVLIYERRPKNVQVAKAP